MGEILIIGSALIFSERQFLISVQNLCETSYEKSTTNMLRAAMRFKAPIGIKHILFDV